MVTFLEKPICSFLPENHIGGEGKEVGTGGVEEKWEQILRYKNVGFLATGASFHWGRQVTNSGTEG